MATRGTSASRRSGGVRSASEVARSLGLTTSQLQWRLQEIGESVAGPTAPVSPLAEARLREYLKDTRRIPGAIPAAEEVEHAGLMVHRVDQMAHWQDVSDMITACKRAEESQQPLVLDVAGVESIWPNTCVPIAAVLDAYKARGLSISFAGEHGRVLTSGVRNPLEATPSNLSKHPFVNKVWVYLDSDQVDPLTNSLVGWLQKTVEMESGVQEALNFCLFEVLDNVFQHSRSGAGFMMTVLQPKNGVLNVAVADAGIGVMQSFAGSQYHPPTHFDALTLAVQAGVTSTGDKRGNGLFALRGTVEKNRGSLILRSGPGKLSIINGQASGQDYPWTPVISAANQGFFLDWQLKLNHPVSLSDVLGMESVNLPLEQLEDDSSGEHVIRIADHETGTGTRKAAEQLRVYLTNCLSLGAPYVVLDFTGVAVVSASFADEVIGKLADEYGMIRFPHHFRLRNMNETVAALLDRAIRLRIAAEPPTAVTRERRRRRLGP